MTQPCTIEETEVVGNDPDLDDALEAALGLWSLIEVVEAQPSTVETRKRVGGARRALDLRLRSLSWDEEFLRENLGVGMKEPDEPPDWPQRSKRGS